MRLLCEALGGTTCVTVWSDAAGGLFVSGPEVERAIRAEMQRNLTALKHLLEVREGGPRIIASTAISRLTSRSRTAMG